MYGLAGPWGDWGRDVLGDVLGTGVEIIRSREGLPFPSPAPAPVVVMSPSSSMDLPKILLIGGLALGALWLIFGRRGR